MKGGGPQLRGAREGLEAGHGSALRWRIMAALLLASLGALVVLSAGGWVVFGRVLESRTMDLHREVVHGHAADIERYLSERLHALDLLARTHTQSELRQDGALRRTFEHLSHSHPKAFVDLGVIDAKGKQLAYVGPYELLGRSYANAPWFREVMHSGTYVSDVFLGLRGSPHCIIAVRRDEGDLTWILRATINSERFDALVRSERLGRTGDVFIVNGEGRYQTPPRTDRVMQRSEIVPVAHEGLRTERLTLNGEPTLQATTWLNDGRWMLVVRQSLAEIRAPITSALRWGGLVIALATAVVAGTVILATRHITGQIDVVIAQRDQLSRELLRSAKLASLGELATGLAHEINNPLAIISSERTNLADVIAESGVPAAVKDELFSSIDRIRRQIERCSSITGKMLRFGRHKESAPAQVDLVPRLGEIVALLQKQAAIRNVELELRLPADLPRVAADPTELEQVMVNLITNSFQAMPEGGHICIRARAEAADGVVLTVSDDGCGISEENLEQIFQPFFTTKPIGQGTGLGLSVCYGLVSNWGGTITAQSRLGEGTTMSIHLARFEPDGKTTT